jgi:GNAT superfamily N-acetyltransferase
MTTTLRPLEDEQSLPGGSRSRRFAVCVNGRPVGGVRVEARPGPGYLLGCIDELVIEPEDRLRGRGTVAVLAAEEVLRAWGCARVDAVIPAGPGESAASQLAAVLGYRTVSRNMAKRLPTQPPELPPGCTARPLDADTFPAWREDSVVGYLGSLRGGGYSEADARAKAESDMHRLLPEGPDTPGAVLRRLEAEGETVGTLWVGLDHTDPRDGRRLAWVWDVEVAEPYRGRGYGRALMLLAERECLAAGVPDLGLNVFAANAPANALYRSLGYVTYRTSVVKYL